jgi:hypothetical protein
MSNDVVASRMSFRLCSDRNHSSFSGSIKLDEHILSSDDSNASIFSVNSSKILNIAGASPPECSYIRAHKPSYKDRFLFIMQY